MRSQAFSTAVMVVGVIALALIVPAVWNGLRSLPARPVLAARAGERIVTLEVGGMTCGGCAARVKKELSAVAGVSAAQVRHRPRRAYVVCRRDLADSALVAAVTEAGTGFSARVVGK